MADKTTYIQEQILKQLQLWIARALIVGATLFPLLSIMDYFATPDNFKQFLLYRLGISLILTFLYYLNNLKKNIHHQYLLIILGAISSAITIEMMILSFGGHVSSYYAGINLLIIVVLGLVPFTQSLSIFLSIAIYGIYIIPILLLDRITNLSFFITSNAFIFSTFAIALTWRILSHRSMLNELSLQYDLEEEKRKLENYSIHLEDKVVQRTKELSASEERYRALFDNANDGIAVLDRSGVIVNVNRKFCELHSFDRNALIGTHFKLLEIEKQKGEKDERIRRLLNGEPLLYETEHYRKDGSRILLEVSSKVIEVGGSLYIQSFHRDITEKKKGQEQLFQSQKMDSLGMLAGGIAHDFKNILTGILGHTEILLENDNLDEVSRQYLTTIESTGRKAGNMVSKLLSFSRKSTYETVPTNINDVVKDVVGLIETTLSKRKIKVEMKLDSNIQLINCNVNQMEQVLLNLIINASDAIENRGEIIIRTSLLELKDRTAARLYPLLKSERNVMISISDTGRGIPDEIKGKIFDPFFTTKEPGKGTGLGLAMVYGIIKEHNGIIDVKTQVGKGTTFEIYLPSFEEFPIHSKDEEPPLKLMSGKENILVVDDESSILSFIKTTLEKQGYRVFATDNPIYAIEIFKQTADDIDIVITDVVMPLIDGRKLIKQIKTVKPTVWVIEISTHDDYADDKTNRNSDAFLSKPFNGSQLLSVVRKVMESN